MKSEKKLTVTIAVPAYNELNNINYLYKSILKQKALSYRLQRIIIICDGSTDGTPRKARKIAKNNGVVSVIDDRRRLGKAARLNQIYKINTSDLVFAFDADMVLMDDWVIEKMVAYFKDKKVAMVIGNKQPVEAQNLVEKLINTWFYLWYEVRKEIDEGHNVYNISTSALALSKSFAKEIEYPSGILFIGGFLYKSLVKKGLKFKFAQDARILFRPPGNLRDYLLQLRRVDKLDVYGVPSEKLMYKIKKALKSMKLKVLLKMLITNPIYTPMAILFHVLAIYWPFNVETKHNQDGLWETVVSSKQAIRFGK